MGQGGVKQKQNFLDKWDRFQVDNGVNVVKDPNGNLGQEYLYPLDSRYDPADQLHILDLRRTAKTPIVRSYGGTYSSKGSTLHPRNQMRVITERITSTLHNAPQLTYNESLYVLDRSLEGYADLYERVGPFQVNDHMIGFTKQGQTRVWLNQNFGINHPSHDRHVLQSTLGDTHYLKTTHVNNPVSYDQSSMVKNIVDVVGDKCENGGYPCEEFNRAIYAHGVGFPEARNIINSALEREGFPRLNNIDLHYNKVLSRISKNEYQTGYTGHTGQRIEQIGQHVEQIRHTGQVQHVQTGNYRPTGQIGHTAISTYVPANQHIVQSSRIPQPIRNSRIISHQPVQQIQGQVFYENRYRPMQNAHRDTRLMFNYIKPTQNFHPTMYANTSINQKRIY